MHRNFITLSDVQKQEVENLNSLLDKGDQQLDEVAGRPIVLSGLGDRKKFLLIMFLAAHSQTKAIVQLIMTGHVYSCEVILRSILENYVNALYILSANNDSRVADFAFAEKDLMLRNYRLLKDYLNSAPPNIASSHFMTEKEIDQHIEEAEQAIAKIKKTYKNASTLGIRKKLQAIDKTSAHRNKKYRPLEISYFHTYYTLCSFTHASHNGLQSFFAKDGEELSFFIGGKPDKISLVILSTYLFYLEMLHLFVTYLNRSQAGTLKTFEGVLKQMAKNS